MKYSLMINRFCCDYFRKFGAMHVLKLGRHNFRQFEGVLTIFNF